MRHVKLHSGLIKNYTKYTIFRNVTTGKFTSSFYTKRMIRKMGFINAARVIRHVFFGPSTIAIFLLKVHRGINVIDIVTMKEIRCFFDSEDEKEFLRALDMYLSLGNDALQALIGLKYISE